MRRKILTILATVFLLILTGLVVLLSTGPRFPAETDSLIEKAIKEGPPELVTGETAYAQSGDIKIWYELIRPAGPPRATVLLIMGTGTSGLLWPQELIQPLLQAGYQVIRYDNRDTGMSDWIKDWQKEHPYTLEDMANDALAVLDSAGVKRAHLIGTSMGGMIGQRLAISHAKRVLSLVSISSSAYLFDPEFAELMNNFTLDTVRLILKYALNPSEQGMIKMMMGFVDLMLADGIQRDDIRPVADFVLYELRRRHGFNPNVMTQQYTAMQVSGSRLDELASIRCPVLVIHGTADPSIPVAHGKKYVPLIPGARTLWLEGAGHVIRDEKSPEMLQEILQLLSAADR